MESAKSPDDFWTDTIRRARLLDIGSASLEKSPLDNETKVFPE